MMDKTQEIAELESILHNYTVFFLVIDVLFFALLFCAVIFLIKFIKDKKNLHASNEYISYTIRGQEEERSRIARELHDTVAQDLRYCKSLSEKKNASELLPQISSILGATIQQVRAMSYNLVPPDITQNDLAANLMSLCAECAEKSGIEFRFTLIDGTDTSFLTADEGLNLYRIVQEALTNILKHAEASEATVMLRNGSGSEEDGLYIFITDDGKGFEPKSNILLATGQKHFGLSGMERRAALIGAKITINSAKGDGTQISIMKKNSAIHNVSRGGVNGIILCYRRPQPYQLGNKAASYGAKRF
ncbi:MAG: sensor histidine kinase [Treponema sp.]|nr:sensor histidine kinase [Treponema sp.]